MDQKQHAAPITQARAAAARYEPPRFEVISLDCEISSYAPDDSGEVPLF